MRNLSDALRRPVRNAVVEQLSHRAGGHLHHTLSDLGAAVRAARRRYDEVDAPAYGVERGGLPDRIVVLLTRLGTTGIDSDTVARTERAVLKKYEELHRAHGSILRHEPHRSEFRGHSRAAEVAAADTTEWADNIGLLEVLREVGASPKGTAPRSIEDVLERLAERGPRVGGLPKGLDHAVVRIETSGADQDSVMDAKGLLRDRYEKYWQRSISNARRKKLLQQRAEFTQYGFPPHVTNRLAERRTEALTDTAKARQLIDAAATKKTGRWFESVHSADYKEGTFTDHLAGVYRYEQQPLSKPELHAFGDKIAVMREHVDATQQRLDALLERSPGLLERGAHRWQTGIDTHRDNLTGFSDMMESRITANEPVNRRMINDTVLDSQAVAIRGYDGEIRMAEKLDHIHELGRHVAVATPTGTQIASQVDIVTDEGRVWHEVKTNDPASQRDSQQALEAQARRQLAISHLNHAYWVDGEPPELKMHFMNGVQPTVKSRIEAIRIEDENGHIMDRHRIEVIDES